MTTFPWDDIDLKGKTSGQVKLKCPACNHRRTNKSDRSLSVNITEGKALCHYCDSVSFREDSSDSGLQLNKERTYEIPPQDWENHTSMSDKMVKYFRKARGISQRTLIENGVTEETQYIPGDQKEMNCMVFNYFRGEKILNKKFRSATKNFAKVKDAENLLYKENDIIDCEEVIICEGEMDALSWWEVGIENAVSVPNGSTK